MTGDKTRNKEKRQCKAHITMPYIKGVTLDQNHQEPTHHLWGLDSSTAIFGIQPSDGHHPPS